MVEPAVPEPLGFQGRDPPALLLVEPTEDQVQAVVVVATGPAPASQAGQGHE
jgi:hypothetical protein